VPLLPLQITSHESRFPQKTMRIKIIGDNNCARATRHLLRMAGFAVTDFLPVEAITHAPHSGYAITIDLAPAPHPLNLSGEIPGGFPSIEPDLAPHRQTALGEVPSSLGGASSRPFVRRGADRLEVAQKGTRAKGSSSEGNGLIHFDSMDSLLEAAVLRHVARLAAAPVIVDRPGGLVHSERELRIIVPVSGDTKMDEAAAVAVEFGVLRGLLELTSPAFAKASAGVPAAVNRLSAAEYRTSATIPLISPRGSRSAAGDSPVSFADAGDVSGEQAGKPAVDPGSGSEGGRKKWWTFGLVLIAFAALIAFSGSGLVGRAQASPRRAVAKITRATLVPADLASVQAVGAFGPGGVSPHLNAALAAAAPQGQFSTGQGVKIFDGTNTMLVDPCKAQTKLYVSINQTANAQLAMGTSSKKIYVCSIHVVVAAATNVALVEGTGTVCATGTSGVGGFGGATAATGWNFAANGGIVLGSGEAAVGAEVTAADNLCLFNSGSGQVSGGISYVVQ
jgi:hypothetical protein